MAAKRVYRLCWCGQLHYSGGLCSHHYHQLRNKQPVPIPQTGLPSREFGIEHLPFKEVETQELRMIMQQAVSRLPYREKIVVRLRFGLDGDGACSLEEVAKELQVTRERIRQLEARAIRHLYLQLNRLAVTGAI